ncbi:MAG: KH domain-containing protein [Clostridia bacterium]|nr:KH domain-containing protein [Clostridia bacterium]MBR4979686.1 KH domain-containing protein [Clostridia bacterium]
MKELLADLAKSIVNYPEKVVVTERNEDDTIILDLKVDESDLGKVIGKQGRIAKAIRTLIRAVANKENKRVVVYILDKYDE